MESTMEQNQYFKKLDIKAFSKDTMLSILETQEKAEVIDDVKKDIKKHAFESESQVEEF